MGNPRGFPFFIVHLHGISLSSNKKNMTQIVLNISDRSIVPGLKKVLSHMGGVEKVQVVRKPVQKKSRREKFLGEFREAVAQTKGFKDGKTTFGTWEEMMNEL